MKLLPLSSYRVRDITGRQIGWSIGAELEFAQSLWRGVSGESWETSNTRMYERDPFVHPYDAWYWGQGKLMAKKWLEKITD